MRQIRKPIADHVAPTPYVKLQQSGDEATAHGQKYYIKGGFVQQTSAALIDVAMATIADAKLPVVQVVQHATGGRRDQAREPDGHCIRAARHPVQLVRAARPGKTRR